MEEQQGDLFEYAYQEQNRIKREQKREPKTHFQEKSKKSRKKILLLIPFFLLIFAGSFAGGYLTGKKEFYCEIERRAFIYPFPRANRKLSYVQGLKKGRLYLARSEEEEDPHYDPFGNGEPYIELDKVRRIDLFPPPKKVKKHSRKLRVDEKRFLGRYRIRVSHHRGLFYIYRSKKGGLGAGVRFTNWGKQRMEFLRSVRVWKNKIYFRRLCRGRRCSEIGAGRALNQKFEGTLSSNRKKIIGAYTGGQSGSRWQASRY